MNPTVNDFVQNVLIPLAYACVPFVASMLVWMLNRLAQKFGVQATAVNKANLETELHTSLNFGIQQVLPQIEQYGWKSPQVQSLILKTAAAYFHERFPDRSKSLGAKATDTAPVFAALSGRLPQAVAVAVASPSTPDTGIPAPAPHVAPQAT